MTKKEIILKKHCKRVCFWYNNKDRELIGILMIVREIKKLDKSVKMMITGADDENRIEKVLRFAPDLVWTYPITTETQIKDYFFCKKVLKCCICVFTTEGFLDWTDNEAIETYAGFFPYSNDLVDYECCWGEAFASTVSKRRVEKGYLRNEKQIYVMGNPMYEKEKLNVFKKCYPIFNGFVEKKEQFKKCVMFLTCFDIGKYKRQDILRAGDIINPKADKESEIAKWVNSCTLWGEYGKKYFECIETLVKKNPDILFLIKLHPHEIKTQKTRLKEKFYDYILKYNNVFVCDEAVPIGVFLQAVDVVCHYGSTVELESYYYKKPTIYIKNTKKTLHQSDSIFASTASVYIDEFDKCNYLIQSINFKENKELDKNLENIMNYYSNRKYEPSFEIAKFILGEKQTQVVKSCELDKEYNLLLVKLFAKGKSLKEKVYYLNDIIKYMKKTN